MRRDRRRAIGHLDESDWSRPVKPRSVAGSLGVLGATAALTAAPLIWLVWTAPIHEGLSGVDDIVTVYGRLHACVDPNIPAVLKTPECRRFSTTTTNATR
jgi:hypothetical protein